ncbi:polysaccharide pyruvyl transferase family protein [Ruoffia sp. FAM 26255]|uniref:polysaccharide pyruvyl transferase family protein n=1 Tax=Ruoffia sp. FAM 26255 TaxID=3259519 RepID=UPI003887023E
MKYLLVSRFNVPNIGDLVIANKLSEIISKYGEVTKYNLTGDPYKFKDIDSVEPTNYSFKYAIVNFISKIGLNFLIDKYIKLKTKYLNIPSINSVDNDKFIDQFDVIIVGGGNMIMSINDDESNVSNFDKYVQIAKKNHLPLFAMDIGIGPFRNSFHLNSAIQSLNDCTVISFRDKQSYDLYISNGGIKEKAEISIDPVFLYKYKNVKGNIEEATEPTIGINIIDSRHFRDKKINYKDTVENYQSLINRLGHVYRIILYTSTKEDQSALDDVYKGIINKKKVKKININGLKDLLNLYDGIDILIGTRMHSMIIAYTKYIPVIGLSWQPKVDALFDIIDSSSMLFNFGNLSNEILNIENLVKKLSNNLNYENKQISNQLKVIRSKANINEEILSDLSHKKINYWEEN